MVAGKDLTGAVAPASANPYLTLDAFAVAT
jgi:hypothetical protein